MIGLAASALVTFSQEVQRKELVIGILINERERNLLVGVFRFGLSCKGK